MASASSSSPRSLATVERGSGKAKRDVMAAAAAEEAEEEEAAAEEEVLDRESEGKETASLDELNVAFGTADPLRMGNWTEMEE